jgi:transcriptional regulator with PAS, ATPase and Fis domain
MVGIKMVDVLIRGPWGIVVPLEMLKAAIQSWGPKPFSGEIKAIYAPEGFLTSELVQEIEIYFKTKVFTEIKEFCQSLESGFILNLDGSDQSLSSSLHHLKAKNVTVIEGLMGQLVWNLFNRLEEQTLQREIYFQALNSTAEGIQIANAQGFEIFINESFLRMSNLKMKDRLGKSVYDVSPDGALACVLDRRVPVKNIRNHPKGTNVEFMSNAAPIFIQNEFYGAVVVGNDITELSRLSKELEESKQAVAYLDKKVSHLAPAKYTFKDIIGNSLKIREVTYVASKAAATDLAILIQGESGTGKEIFAHSIHNDSARSANPFIAVNCAAIPEQLLESEFFGYEKGAFTSASNRKLGMFDLAHTGTLFLDEIGDMNLNLQSKLLRVLQDKEYLRVGGTKPVKADVRIIAATNRNLAELIREGKFREDLFYRLNVINLKIPPLRNRMEDLEDLSNYLIRRIRARVGGQVQGISGEALNILMMYFWPGNIRELENVLERAVFLCQGSIIRPEDIHLPEVFEKKVPEINAEKKKIIEYLLTYGYSVEGKKEVARHLNISLATLYNKIKHYELNDFYLRQFKA